MHVSTHTVCVSGAYGDNKGVSFSQELQLEMVVCYHAGARMDPVPLQEQQMVLTTEQSLQSCFVFVTGSCCVAQVEFTM